GGVDRGPTGRPEAAATAARHLVGDEVAAADGRAHHPTVVAAAVAEESSVGDVHVAMGEREGASLLLDHGRVARRVDGAVLADPAAAQLQDEQLVVGWRQKGH